MNAYAETYVAGAQQRLGTMLDAAVNVAQREMSQVWRAFVDSGLGARFGAGDPALVAGRSGLELAAEVLAFADGRGTLPDLQACETSPSPEFWGGWVLAYYQWQSGATFAAIDRAVPVTAVCALYSPFHEMDIRQVCDEIDRLVARVRPETQLQERRLRAGLSQRQLAEAAGIPVRTLQQYEQRQKDINRARADYVAALAKALSCTTPDLLEHRAGEEYRYEVVRFPG